MTSAPSSASWYAANGPASTCVISMILMPSYGLMDPPLDLQHLGAGRGLELAGVDRHREHGVVADRARELDESVGAEAPDERLHRRFVHPVLAHELAGELDDLRVLGRDAAAVVLADSGNRRLRHIELARSAGLGAPYVHGLELARDGHGREHAHAHVERALEAHVGAQVREASRQF